MRMKAENKKMKKGQVYEGIVERVDFPNKGIVKAGEETVEQSTKREGGRPSA